MPNTSTGCPNGHPPTSLYATKMAEPRGVAIFGVHFRCEDCDETANTAGLAWYVDNATGLGSCGMCGAVARCWHDDQPRPPYLLGDY